MTTSRTMYSMLAALALGSLLSGCGDDSSAPAKQPTRDAAADTPSEDAGGVVWAPEPAPSSGPAVYLGDATVQDGKLRFPVRGKGIDALYGVAFRIEYEASALAFAGASKGEAWTTGGDVVDAKQARPGLLVAVVTSKGANNGLDVVDGTLAWLEFSVLEEKSSELRFVAQRSAIVQPDGTELAAVTWSGGALIGP